MRKPLQDIVVLSLAEQYPGPYATLLLADLGADVVLVERPGIGDPARQFTGFHAALNRNKRSIVLDLKRPDEREMLLGLAKKADILLEGYRPGTMDRLGLGYAALSAANPRLIYASISGFGQDGPYRDRPAHDFSYQGLAGFMFANARAGVPPDAPDVAVGDLSSGMFAALAVLAALVERNRTGRGTYIDVSMTDGLVSWMTVFLSPAMNGEEPTDIGAEPAYAAFRCADGKLLTLSIAHEDWFWRPLCSMLGMEDAADLHRPERVARYDELKGRIAAALETKSRPVWSELLDAQGIPWSPVSDLDEVAADPHFRARGLFRQVGGSWHVAQPVKFDGEHPAPTRPSPALGEHTDEVLRQFGLGRREGT